VSATSKSLIAHKHGFLRALSSSGKYLYQRPYSNILASASRRVCRPPLSLSLSFIARSGGSFQRKKRTTIRSRVGAAKQSHDGSSEARTEATARWEGKEGSKRAKRVKCGGERERWRSVALENKDNDRERRGREYHLQPRADDRPPPTYIYTYIYIYIYIYV